MAYTPVCYHPILTRLLILAKVSYLRYAIITNATAVHYIPVAGNPSIIADWDIISSDTPGSFLVQEAFLSGTPVPTSNNVQWSFNGGQLPMKISPYLNQITFPSFDVSDAGEYTVTVNTSTGTAMDHFRVFIRGNHDGS